MPQIKGKFYWEGKMVSKSTYHRRLRDSEAALAGFEKQEASRTLLPDVDMAEAGHQSEPQTDAPPMVLTDTEVALIGDFMVGLRSGRQIDDRFPVTVAPRLFRAVISALIKAGY